MVNVEGENVSSCVQLAGLRRRGARLSDLVPIEYWVQVAKCVDTCYDMLCPIICTVRVNSHFPGPDCTLLLS